ncbi:MAG: DUF99 family protein [Thermoplasmatales archaeon]|nr:DUF99 family protein [Thermoplasmatales archaeon]
MKKEIRIIGIDDMPFSFNDSFTDIVGVVMRGGKYLEGVLKTTIEVDGKDATDKIIDMIQASGHRGQIKIIMINGVALGGFNIVDCEKLFNATDIPVITVARKKPNIDKIEEALKKHFDDWRERIDLINKGRTEEIKLRYPIYIKYFGIGKKSAIDAIKLSIIRGAIPEPIRVAHLIATGIKKGESRGRC